MPAEALRSRPMHVLVTGFGSFLDVVDNPSGRLALAIDGYHDDLLEVTGRVLPVSYRRGPATAVALARSLAVDAVLGLGVAVGRTALSVERRAVRCVDPGVPDIDGDGVDAIQLDGPDERLATMPVIQLAEALGATVSEDAGRYVCNAWLYQVTAALGSEVPVGFVHLPADGMEPDRLLAGLHWLSSLRGGKAGHG